MLCTRVLFSVEFSPADDDKKKRKKSGESNKGIVENFLKKFAISRGKKKVRSRQI
jgi:hypothetical protein